MLSGIQPPSTELCMIVFKQRFFWESTDVSREIMTMFLPYAPDASVSILLLCSQCYLLANLVPLLCHLTCVPPAVQIDINMHFVNAIFLIIEISLNSLVHLCLLHSRSYMYYFSSHSLKLSQRLCPMHDYIDLPQIFYSEFPVLRVMICSWSNPSLISTLMVCKFLCKAERPHVSLNNLLHITFHEHIRTAFYCLVTTPTPNLWICLPM